MKPRTELNALNRNPEVKINKTLEEIIERYNERFIKKAGDYSKAKELYKSEIETFKSYTSKDIQEFSILLGNYQKLRSFFLSGIYLSMLCNNCNDLEITIHTDHINYLIDYLGYKNNGKLITIQGNAGALVGNCMKDGTINVQGNAGDLVGNCMKDGTINIDGDCSSLSVSILGGNIYHKGKLIVEDGKLIS